MNQRHTYPFSDPFLVVVQAGIAKRAKSLAHRGQLTIRGSIGDGERAREWLELAIVLARANTVILVARPHHHVDIQIRSHAARSRGRISFRMEDLRVPSNAAAIVAAFEQTMSLAYVADDDPLPDAEIRRVWQRITVHVA
jgi:hypothetical protein